MVKKKVVNKDESNAYKIEELKQRTGYKVAVFLGIAFILMVIILMFGTIINNTITKSMDNKVGFDCSIEGINYINVSPDKCWGNFSASHCPTPTDIKCSGNVENIPAFLMGQ